MAGAKRIEVQQAESFRMLFYQSPKRRAKGCTRTIGRFHPAQHLVGERQLAKAVAQFRKRHLADIHAADRPAVRDFIRDRNLDGVSFVIEYPGVVHFCEIVVFRRQPKYRNRRNACSFRCFASFTAVRALKTV